MWPEIGDLLFSVVVGYMGAIELFFVFRQIYHLAFQHEKRLALASDAESLKKLQDQIDKEIVEASEKEKFGLKAMKDGVLYKDGFRVDPEEIRNLEKIQERQVIGGSENDVQKNDQSESIKPELVDEKSIKHEVFEESCIKKESLFTLNQSETAENERTNLTQTVKTQIGQTNLDNYRPDVESENNKISLGKSEDSSSTEPLSLQSSSLSNQKSSSIETSEIHFDEYEREAPDGEDVPEQQYSDEYLRSLDGIKHRPLVRDDGTKRRRAFKKRRSSDSTSSRESRASREEELKMFTSLEEEEFEAIKRGECEYVPIKYSSDPNLKVGKHRRRHRKSPVKDSKLSEEEEFGRESVKEYGEDNTNPWGDIKPEQYRNTEFWKREKATSIEEEGEENTNNLNYKSKVGQIAEEVTASPSAAKNIPKMSSFEEATRSQHETVASALERQSSRDIEQKEHENSDLDKMGNVSKTDDYLIPLSEPTTSFIDQRSTDETDDKIACDQSDVLSESPEVRCEGSPRFKQYEKRLHDEENKRFHAYSPSSDSQQELFETYNKLAYNQAKVQSCISPHTSDIGQDEDTSMRGLSGMQSSANSELQTTNTNNAELTPLPELNTTFNTGTLNTDVNLSPLGKQILEESEKSSLTTDILSTPNTESAIELDNQLKFGERPKTPVIEIECAYDDISATYKNKERALNDQDEEEKITGNLSGLMEGISDFYDFNASINPARLRSSSRHVSKSRSTSRASSKGRCKSLDRSRIPAQVPSSAKGVLGLSDFYDYNVMLNQQAYGYKINREREAHRSTVDYIVNELKNNSRKHHSDLRSTIPKNGDTCLQEEGGGTKSDDEYFISESQTTVPLEKISSPESIFQKHSKTPEGNVQSLKSNENASQTPSTPEYQRSFSGNLRYIEKLKDEYRNLSFKRSAYVGESMDFSDDFEDLREQTRHFKRSRSQSRSPVLENGEASALSSGYARRKLQEKILAEITKTTRNYQEFAEDINREFLEHERRGSDSALMQKPKILFQLQDERRSGKYGDEDDELSQLEDEEYHHFRRFSLNQEQPVEEYPSDDYVYLEQIEVRTSTGTRSWMRRDYYDSGERSTFQYGGDRTQISISLDDDDRAEAEDLDSESEDERQTVVEVDDEIDEDIWEYDRPEDYNEQSECEEAEREMDRYANRNAEDWTQEVMAAESTNQCVPNIKDNVINIEQMYDDALKNTEEADIQRDYETIVETLEREEKKKARFSGEFDDAISVKTEDLLEEILREDEEKYNCWSPRSERLESRSSSQLFIDNESSFEASLRSQSSSRISSTRLRSRYGLPPATSYKTYENLDTLDVDMDYKPKKEYNWRKNFKLDDDESSIKVYVSEPSTEEAHDQSDDQREYSHFLDTRKYSLGGESITLFSRSPEREITEAISEEGDLEEKWNSENNEKDKETQNANFREKMLEVEHIKIEDIEKLPKKRKGKKKTGKGSKDYVETDETINSKHISEDESEVTENSKETSIKKKIKRKKKTNEMDNVAGAFADGKTSSSLQYKDNPTFTAKSTSPEIVTSNVTTKTEPNISTDPKTQHSDILKQKSPEPTTSKSKIPEPVKHSVPQSESNEAQKKPKLKRNDSTGVYELIKDGSMYPWF